MAEDLTPPPRITPPPSPFAEPDAPVEETTDENVLVLKPRSEWEPGPHAGRFMLAYGLLGLVLGATVVALAVGLTRGDSASPRRLVGVDAGRQRHAARPRHRRARRSPLPPVERQPAGRRRPAIRVGGSADHRGGDRQAGALRQGAAVQHLPLDKSLMFVFCGDGQNCALQGQPTIERHRLLRREALELALYSFRYIDGVDSVVTFLPGAPTRPPGTTSTAVQSALFFRKSQYDNFTKAPLAETLPGTPAQTNSSLSQATVVDRLTLPALYRSELKLTPDGGNSILVLIPAVTG